MSDMVVTVAPVVALTFTIGAQGPPGSISHESILLVAGYTQSASDSADAATADAISTAADVVTTNNNVATIDDTLLTLSTNLIATQAIVAQYHAFS